MYQPFFAIVYGTILQYREEGNKSLGEKESAGGKMKICEKIVDIPVQLC